MNCKRCIFALSMSPRRCEDECPPSSGARQLNSWPFGMQDNLPPTPHIPQAAGPQNSDPFHLPQSHIADTHRTKDTLWLFFLWVTVGGWPTPSICCGRHRVCTASLLLNTTAPLGEAPSLGSLGPCTHVSARSGHPFGWLIRLGSSRVRDLHYC